MQFYFFFPNDFFQGCKQKLLLGMTCLYTIPEWLELDFSDSCGSHPTQDILWFCKFSPSLRVETGKANYRIMIMNTTYSHFINKEKENKLKLWEVKLLFFPLIKRNVLPSVYSHAAMCWKSNSLKLRFNS